ncbi:MAG TPA: hypothetical protein VNI77_05550 [Nitrososphaera sp.]|nr:hypothetical protein [Nitrososphaera sp.]
MLKQSPVKTTVTILLASALLFPMGQNVLADDERPRQKNARLDKFGIEKIYQTKKG